MDFVKYISTPAGQAEASPLVSKVKLTRGLLVGGTVIFPPGPAGLLYFLIRMGIHQIMPFNTGESIHLDDCAFSFSIGIDLTEPPFDIDLVTWAPLATLSHAITVSLSLEPNPENQHDLKKLIANFAADEAGIIR